MEWNETVGPCHIVPPHPLLYRSFLRRRLLRPVVQAKSVARVGGIRVRSWEGLGGS